jgi:hypothetical protein
MTTEEATDAEALRETSVADKQRTEHEQDDATDDRKA